MTARLEGRTALISGGARGQGAAHGRRLAEEGAAVILGDSKGAVIAMTKVAALEHARDGIRVNATARVLSGHR